MIARILTAIADSMDAPVAAGESLIGTIKIVVLPNAKVFTMCFLGLLMASKYVNILPPSGRKQLNGGLKTAIIKGDVVGGTCVNRGCVPSKAVLAVSGRMREHQNKHHMKAFGLQVSAAGYDRQGVSDNANNLATKIRNNLTNSMKALGVDILTGFGSVLGPQKVKYGKDNVITTKDINHCH